TRPTVCVTVARLPATSTGAVSTLSRVSIVERGPFTSTEPGSTRTRVTAYPVAGCPRTLATARIVFSAALATATRSWGGVMRVTRTPGGVWTSDGASVSWLSPSGRWATLTRTRSASLVRRLAAHGDRHASGLLGYDERDRVAFLADAERGAVPRAELPSRVRRA